jgi:hypothetical protein
MRQDGRRGHLRPRCLRREPTCATVVLVPGRAYSLAAHQRWVARLLADLLPVLNLREVA